MLDLKQGTRRAGNVVNLAIAGIGNAQPIFQQSNWGNQIGTKSFRIKRLKIRNNAAGTNFLHVGTGVGAAFVDRMPPLLSVNGMTDDWAEYDLPEYVFVADCTAYPAALAAGGSMDVQVEVEEIG
jgi:hypothetical protein